jgi:uncharacterized membrane protein YdjX (TVP38/TMEM64 family)
MAKPEAAPGRQPDHSGKRWLKIMIAALFAGAIVAFFAFGGEHYVNLETIKANRDLLLSFTAEHYAGALVLAFVIYTAATAFSVPGGLVLSLTLGFLFGRWVATALIVVAGTLGATMLFLAARYLFADFARRRLGAVGKKINTGFTENAFSYLLFLRLVPLFPFFLVNLAPALTDIPVRTYVLATFIGILPGTFVFTNFGQTLGRIQSTGELFEPQTIAAFVLLGMFALVPVAVKKFRQNRGR